MCPFWFFLHDSHAQVQIRTCSYSYSYSCSCSNSNSFIIPPFLVVLPVFRTRLAQRTFLQSLSGTSSTRTSQSTTKRDTVVPPAGPRTGPTYEAEAPRGVAESRARLRSRVRGWRTMMRTMRTLMGWKWTRPILQMQITCIRDLDNYLKRTLRILLITVSCVSPID